MESEKESEKKGHNFWEWLMWWKVEDKEIDEQVKGYTTLGFLASARKLSFALLLFSAAISVLFVYLKLVDPSVWVDITVSLILGFFIFRGHKWAMITAMLFWTFEKFYAILVNYNASQPYNWWLQLLWWSWYMHAFWLSFQVERRITKKVVVEAK